MHCSTDAMFLEKLLLGLVTARCEGEHLALLRHMVIIAVNTSNTFQEHFKYGRRSEKSTWQLEHFLLADDHRPHSGSTGFRSNILVERRQATLAIKNAKY